MLEIKGTAISAASFCLIVMWGGQCTEAKSQADSDRLVCEDLSDGRYCFSQELVSSSGDDGFLLELPLGALDDPCYSSRETWGVATVLFGDFRMPDRTYPISPSQSATNAERRVVDPSDHYFEASQYEVETCHSGKLIAGTFCTLDSSWNGMRLRFRFYRECGPLAKEFAKDLEESVADSRQTDPPTLI